MINITNRNFVLLILILVGVVTNFERFVFSLVLEPIKHELELSDSQLGLMTGVAFFAFYAIAGIPIARWADKGNRATITALAVGVCGVMVSLCGVVTSFMQLLLVRAGVAVGEAGIMPAGQSLISDYFDRHERPKAMAIYITLYTISMIIGYLIGGWLVEIYGWRTTFIIIGLPGLFLAVVAKLLIHEPRTSQPVTIKRADSSIIKALFILCKQQSFRQILIIFCLGYFLNAGVSQWLPTFLIRTHGMTSSEVGSCLALAFGVFGTVGILLGGYISSRYAAGKEKIQMRLLAFSTVLYGITMSIAYLASNKSVCLSFIAIGSVFMMLNNGPIFAAIQSLVNSRMRSLAVAVTFMFGNLVGLGFGPLLLGILSDSFAVSLGQDSLRYALLAFCPGTLWMAFHYWQVSNSIESDIKANEADQSTLVSDTNCGQQIHSNIMINDSRAS